MPFLFVVNFKMVPQWFTMPHTATSSFSSKPKAVLEWPGCFACLCQNVLKFKKLDICIVLNSFSILSVMKNENTKIFSVLNKQDKKVDSYEICETGGSHGSDHLSVASSKILT